jgi:hypothetical protein
MEVVAVSFATDGDYDDDLGHGYIRRPISVAELFEREGYRPAQRSKATKRALSGVAAGAVLALGAVVGSLLLNHGGTTTAGDTLASGGIGQSGGDIVLAETGPQSSTTAPSSASHTNPVTQGATAGATRTTTVRTSGSRVVTGTQRVGSVGNKGSGNHSPVSASSTTGTGGPVASTTSTTGATATNPTTGQSTPTTGTTTTTTPTGSSSPTTGTTTTTPPSTGSSAPTTTTSGNGGLVGSVTGVLGDVTQPVFNWFG